jgi:hypothetical protein
MAGAVTRLKKSGGDLPRPGIVGANRKRIAIFILD